METIKRWSIYVLLRKKKKTISRFKLPLFTEMLENLPVPKAISIWLALSYVYPELQLKMYCQDTLEVYALLMPDQMTAPQNADEGMNCMRKLNGTGMWYKKRTDDGNSLRRPARVILIIKPNRSKHLEMNLQLLRFLRESRWWLCWPSRARAPIINSLWSLWVTTARTTRFRNPCNRFKSQSYSIELYAVSVARTRCGNITTFRGTTGRNISLWHRV